MAHLFNPESITENMASHSTLKLSTVNPIIDSLVFALSLSLGLHLPDFFLNRTGNAGRVSSLSDYCLAICLGTIFEIIGRGRKLNFTLAV